MENVNFEKEICEYLRIPTIPKRKWDGKTSFKDGCAVIEHTDGSLSYAVATFDDELDNEPRVRKVFTLEMFNKVHDIFVVPEYMDTDVEEMDLDEESKEKAKLLVDEASELEVQGKEEDFSDANEYVFDNIHNDEEATAFIRAYNKKHKKKGGLPKTHEGIIMRLNVIYKDMNKNNK